MRKTALLLPGKSFQKRLSVICKVNKIKRVVRADNLCKNVEIEIISDPDSEYFIFAWNIKDVLYWYTEGEEVYLNEDCSEMFERFWISDLNFIKDFNPENIRTVSFMFSGCKKLTDISSLSYWNTSKIQDMSGLFFDCKGLKNLSALRNWDVGNVVNLLESFSGCKNLMVVEDLRNWNVSKVENMYATFGRCESLKSLNGLENWNIENLKDANSCFWFCINLTDITALKSWDVRSVENIVGIFKNCWSLENIESLNDWNMKEPNPKPFGNTYMAFYDCQSLSLNEHTAEWVRKSYEVTLSFGMPKKNRR